MVIFFFFPKAVVSVTSGGKLAVQSATQVPTTTQIIRTSTPATTPGTVPAQAATTTQTQLSGQAHVFTAQAQSVMVGGQRFVITPAQVQVQGTGQMIAAQLIQTTTGQGTSVQRLVLTPNATTGQGKVLSHKWPCVTLADNGLK